MNKTFIPSGIYARKPTLPEQLYQRTKGRHTTVTARALDYFLLFSSEIFA